jgi:hypothetical protein
VWASSNGNIQFSSQSTAVPTSDCPFPIEHIPQRSIYAYWGDLDTLKGIEGGIYTKTSGSAPNRTFSIVWDACQKNPKSGACDAFVTFEVRLFEGQSRFEIIYDLVPNLEGYNDSVVVGVQKQGSPNAVYDAYSLHAEQPKAYTRPQANLHPPASLYTYAMANQYDHTPSAYVHKHPYHTAHPHQYSNTLPNPGECGRFADVPSTHTFFPYVRCVACQGLIGGYQCGGPGEPCVCGSLPYFRPNNYLTRSQLAKMVAIGANYPETPTTQTFEDVPPGSTFHRWIEQLATRGHIGGYDAAGLTSHAYLPLTGHTSGHTPIPREVR